MHQMVRLFSVIVAAALLPVAELAAPPGQPIGSDEADESW